MQMQLLLSKGWVREFKVDWRKAAFTKARCRLGGGLKGKLPTIMRTLTGGELRWEERAAALQGTEAQLHPTIIPIPVLPQ